MSAERRQGASITGLLLRGAVCVDCLALKTELPARQIEATLQNMRRHVVLKAGAGSCELCRARTLVYRLEGLG